MGNQFQVCKLSNLIMISTLIISCFLVVPAVLGNDPQCTRCCNLESTVVESTVKLVECEKDGVDCPEEENAVVDYLPEYMRCLTKRKKRAVSEPSCEDYCVAGHCSVTCGRDGKSLQFILNLLPKGIVNALGLGGDDDGTDSDSDGSDDEGDASDDDGDGSDEDEEEEGDEDEDEEEDEGEDGVMEEEDAD